jgi:CRP-like cAMP-binding protein
MIDRHTARHNRLLAALPEAALADLSAHLTPVTLVQGEALFEPGDTLTHVHFPLRGLVSIVTVMADGTAVETATVGPEGAVGLVQAIGTGKVFWRAIVQLPGEALCIERTRLQAIGAVDEAVREIARRYTEAVLMQVLQLVACNALHGVEARLARWLLTCRNCVCDDRLPLTQGFLAEMLGVSRTTVTQVARNLQRAKLIAYRHGQVRLLDHPGLERCACECHARIRHGFDVLLPLLGKDEWLNQNNP